jgi:hypothetical protein
MGILVVYRPSEDVEVEGRGEKCAGVVSERACECGREGDGAWVQGGGWGRGRCRGGSEVGTRRGVLWCRVGRGDGEKYVGVVEGVQGGYRVRYERGVWV